MTLDNVSTILNDAIQVIIVTSLPSVGLGLLVGLIIALFQAVTQIQEQTLAIIPKMAAILLIFALLFPWMLSQATTYMNSLFSNFPTFLGL